MITLFVLILLLASNVRSGDDYEEMQSMLDIQQVIELHDSLNRIDIATAIWSDADAYRRLQNSQKDVIIRQIACEARPELHDEQKRLITNQTENEILKADLLQSNMRTCDNVTIINESNTSLEHCPCDPSSSAIFCLVLEAKNLTINERLEIEEEMGELPCADQLWRDVDAVFNNTGIPFLKTMNSEQIDSEVLIYAEYTNRKVSVNDAMQYFYETDYKFLEFFCVNTPQLHRILRKLRNVDIRFRIFDDLFKAKFMSMVPFSFCDKDYLLSKCMCDKQSSAIFCTAFFFKHAALTFANETMCDEVDPGLTSNFSPSLSFSIVATVLLSLLIARSF